MSPKHRTHAPDITRTQLGGRFLFIFESSDARLRDFDGRRR